mgnify:FL=1
MNINLDKRDALIKNNVAKIFVPVNAERGTEFAKENARVEYTMSVVFKTNVDGSMSNEVKHLWLTEKNPINAYDK